MIQAHIRFIRWRVKRETCEKGASRSSKFWVRSSESLEPSPVSPVALVPPVPPLSLVSLVSPFSPVSRAKTVFPQPVIRNAMAQRKARTANLLDCPSGFATLSRATYHHPYHLHQA